MSEHDYELILDLFDKGSFVFKIRKSHCPRTVTALEKLLPLRSRGIKKSGKFTITSNLSVRKENDRKSFDPGDISVDPSSGNLTIHFESVESPTSLTYLGKINELNWIEKVKLTQGLEIRTIQEL
ncbi:MAG: cyclophilin-like fold protein [Candidatus Kariarchaeaceae archaeon]